MIEIFAFNKFHPSILLVQAYVLTIVNTDIRSSSFSISFFYAHFFSPTSGIIRKLKYYWRLLRSWCQRCLICTYKPHPNNFGLLPYSPRKNKQKQKLFGQTDRQTDKIIFVLVEVRRVKYALYV